MPVASGTMSATTICADVTASTSVRCPPTSTVLPCQCGVCALLKSPSVVTYQRTRSPFFIDIMGMLPKINPLMDHLTLVKENPVPAIGVTTPFADIGSNSLLFTPLGSVV